MPREPLLRLKACLADPVRRGLPDALRHEQAMHDRVFEQVRSPGPR
jgi:hypothetical protein